MGISKLIIVDSDVISADKYLYGSTQCVLQRTHVCALGTHKPVDQVHAHKSHMPLVYHNGKHASNGRVMREQLDLAGHVDDKVGS
jgi:hypothetical protein